MSLLSHLLSSLVSFFCTGFASVEPFKKYTSHALGSFFKRGLHLNGLYLDSYVAPSLYSPCLPMVFRLSERTLEDGEGASFTFCTLRYLFFLVFWKSPHH